MSTILKALRRLENDDPKKKRTGGAPTVLRDAPAAIPATDPRAADALRGRILAEEAAARIGVSPSEDERPPSTRARRPLVLATLAGALLIAVFSFALTKSGLFSAPPNRNAAADAAPPTRLATAEPALAPTVSPPPSAPEPAAAPRAMVAVQSSLAVPEQPPTLPTAAPAPAPAASVAAVAPPAPSAPVASVATSARPTTTNVTATPVEPVSPTPQTSPTPAVAIPSPASAPSAVTPSAPPAPTQTAAARPPSTRPADSIAKPTVPVAASPRPATPAAIPVPAAEPRRVEPRPEPEAQSAAKPEPVRPDEFKRVAPAGFAEVTVVRTAWHPKPERRSAKVRIVETDELVTAREGDTVAGLVLREITPSAVVFSAGDVEIRRRVGEKTAPH